MPRGHAEQVAHAHGLEIVGRRGGRVFREELQYFVIDAQLAFGHREADCRGGETFAQRIQHVPRLGRVRRPPAFGDHVAVPHEHETVHLVDLPVGSLNEVQDSRGSYPLRLRDAARQGG